jgi:pimeloyl-ACP methyl ester carboxylesterase
MDELLGILKGLAPAVATIVGGPLGGLAVTALASKFGVADDVAAVAKAIAGDPEAATKLAELDLRQFQAESADRDSARQRESAVAAAGGSSLAQMVVPILALGTVSLTFVFIGILLFKVIDTAQQQLVIFALGYATAAAQQVLSYYFGSSKSSQDKTVALQKALK